MKKTQPTPFEAYRMDDPKSFAEEGRRRHRQPRGQTSFAIAT
jgi:hypothetical protein